MKNGDMISVEYTNGTMTGIIKKVTPKTYTVEFKNGETKRVNKKMNIKLIEESAPVKKSVEKTKPVKSDKVKEVVPEESRPDIRQVHPTTPVVKEKGFFKDENKFSWKLWLVIIGTIGIVVVAILKSQGVF